MQTTSFEQLVDTVWQRKVPFVLTFFVIFTVTFAGLAWLDWLPEPIDPESQTASQSNRESEIDSATEIPLGNASEIEETENTPVPTAEYAGSAVMPGGEAEMPVASVVPISLTFTSLNRTVTVKNPTSRAIPDLDAALLDGVVRHPDSAHLAQPGTVFILGHSSYLPVVQNSNFRAFNGIQNLAWGDIIEVTAAEGTFTYRVDRVYRARAQEVIVPIAGDEYRLTLATCNSFGSVDDRFIVEAIRISLEA